MNRFNIVLVEPEIPPNTGNVIRMCANTGVALHLVEPLGFDLDDARLRRAGLEEADALVAAGVKAILSFAPTVVDVPEDVVVRHVDVASELEILAFHEGRRVSPLGSAG